MQIEFFDDFFAGGSEVPFFDVMIRINELENDAPHVRRIPGGKVRGINEIEADAFAVRRERRLHAGLIAGCAIMGEQQTVAGPCGSWKSYLLACPAFG